MLGFFLLKGCSCILSPREKFNSGFPPPTKGSDLESSLYHEGHHLLFQLITWVTTEEAVEAKWHRSTSLKSVFSPPCACKKKPMASSKNQDPPSEPSLFHLVPPYPPVQSPATIHRPTVRPAEQCFGRGARRATLKECPVGHSTTLPCWGDTDKMTSQREEEGRAGERVRGVGRKTRSTPPAMHRKGKAVQ